MHSFCTPPRYTHYALQHPRFGLCEISNFENGYRPVKIISTNFGDCTTAFRVNPHDTIFSHSARVSEWRGENAISQARSKFGVTTLYNWAAISARLLRGHASPRSKFRTQRVRNRGSATPVARPVTTSQPCLLTRTVQKWPRKLHAISCVASLTPPHFSEKNPVFARPQNRLIFCANFATFGNAARREWGRGGSTTHFSCHI